MLFNFVPIPQSVIILKKLTTAVVTDKALFATAVSVFADECRFTVYAFHSSIMQRHIFVVESTQSGIPGVINPFGDAQGAWKCTPNGKITATTLNFSYPGAQGPGFVARTDYSVTFDQKTQMLQGTVSIRFFDFDANPLADDAPVVGTFDFAAQRVTTD